MKFLDYSELEAQSLDINITPLVDIVFLLLIFFMVTTKFVDEHGINVKLPQASAKPVKSADSDIIVTINEKGEIYVNDTLLSLEALAAELKSKHTSNPNLVLILRADKTVRHGHVVDVMDKATALGIKNIAIATQVRNPG